MVFGPWDFKKSQKEVSENFKSQTTVALVIEIYLPCEFHKFSLSHSLETPARGGGVPLKFERIKREFEENKILNNSVIAC